MAIPLPTALCAQAQIEQFFERLDSQAFQTISWFGFECKALYKKIKSKKIAYPTEN